MWLFEPLTGEQLVTGDDAQLHMSPQGLALSRAGEVAADVSAAVADYQELSEVTMKGGRRVRLQLSFADGRRPWRLRGVPRPHGQWALYTIEGYQKLLAWASTDEATKPLEFDTIAGCIERYADDLPLLGNLLIAQAVAHGASDMDLEPAGDIYGLRYRIDGGVFPVAKLPAATAERLVRMLKNQARLQSHRSDVTQEGRIRLYPAAGPVDLRLTVMPGVAGEKVNVRLLNPATQLFGLDQLGMTQQQAEQMKALLARPTGAVLLCGPGGAGKTTTIYAALSSLAAQDATRTIATIENPVEFDLDGIAQTQIGPQLDFSAALSVLLRQDPGVVMVGEIRDPQTAQIAMRAGMTGQLLLTTVHAGGPELVIPRLLDLDVEPYMVSSALAAIVSQRLVRKVCAACAGAYQPTAEEMAALGLSSADLSGANLQTGNGCPACHNTGYRGRTGIFDTVLTDEDIRSLIMARDMQALRARLTSDGLRAAAIEKVKAGVTDIAEAIRVVGAAQ